MQNYTFGNVALQYHHHGYVTGDPRVQPVGPAGKNRTQEFPDRTDVLIVGAGPAGAITAAQLSHFGSIHTRIVEARPTRLEFGHADGLQQRTSETFQAFGFATQVRQEALQLTETSFWRPSPTDATSIQRVALTTDDESGMSEFPHLILNQARVIDYFAEYSRNGPARVGFDYGIEFIDALRDDDHEYPLEVTLRHTAGEHIGQVFSVRTKYLVGADGARSRVRKAIGGTLSGNDAMHAWGVMDVLAETDFPDIRKKCAIQSSDGGNILLIPREGQYLFRMYVDLGEVKSGADRNVRDTTIEQIIDRANKIVHPYALDVRHVAWYSVYEVAHRLTDRFDDAQLVEGELREPRVFLMGDACHTHSAKAGLGMNVSIQDGWNLAWKLGYVLDGRSPDTLLRSYSDERQEIAQNLIDFDKIWSTMMAKRPEEFASATELEDFYVNANEFPAGFMTQYHSPTLTGATAHQELASGYPIGKRFKSAPTVRVADATPVHIGHHHRADGKYRIYVFADAERVELTRWSKWMSTSDRSPLRLFDAAEADVDSTFDIKVIYQQPHREVDISEVPKVFLPPSGPFQLTDYEKVYATFPEDDIFELRGVSREGAVVVVRPDQYVAHILPLSAPDELSEFLAGFLRDRTA